MTYSEDEKGRNRKKEQAKNIKRESSTGNISSVHNYVNVGTYLLNISEKILFQCTPPVSIIPALRYK